jgi:catechol 2,3-dioxygenase-like lactoylglutathione lyase family enzyme
MQTRLTHVRANVRNLQQAIGWYTNTLGFELRGLWPPENPNYADFAAQEGATFSVMEAQPVPAGARFNFAIEDVDAFWESLKARVTVVEPLFDTAYGTRKFTIADPDGNELGFVKG